MAITQYRKFTSISLLILLFLGLISPVSAHAAPDCNLLCGKWMSTEKNLAVQVYREGDEFRAKIIWFDDSSDKSRPMDVRTDDSNPNKTLRDRKILGMSVLENLVYNPKSNTWEKGQIYDAVHGHYWDSAAYITPQGVLKVTGYWHFKFIGRTLSFVRMPA